MSQSNTQPTDESEQSPTDDEADSGIIITNDASGSTDSGPNTDTSQGRTETAPASDVAESEGGTDEEETATESDTHESDSTAENDSYPEGDDPVNAEEPSTAESDTQSTASADANEPTAPAPATDEESASEGTAEAEATPEDDADSTADPADEEQSDNTPTMDADTQPAEEPTDEEATTDTDANADAAADTADTASASDSDTGTDSIALENVSSPPDRFEAVVEAGVLESLITSTGVLVDECKIRTSPDGLHIRAVDPANVAMVDLSLNAEAFESLDTTKGLLGLPLERFEDVINLANKGDLVHLEYDTRTRKLNIRTGGIEYTQALIDPDSIRAEPDIPDLDLPCEIGVEASDLNRGINAADMVSDHIGLRAVAGYDEQLVIEAEGDTDDVELCLEDEDLAAASIRDSVESLFSLDYLKDINKALPKDAIVTMDLGEEFPLKLHFGDQDGTLDVTYMLAPRIQSE